MINRLLRNYLSRSLKHIIKYLEIDLRNKEI